MVGIRAICIGQIVPSMMQFHVVTTDLVGMSYTLICYKVLLIATLIVFMSPEIAIHSSWRNIF